MLITWTERLPKEHGLVIGVKGNMHYIMKYENRHDILKMDYVKNSHELHKLKHVRDDDYEVTIKLYDKRNFTLSMGLIYDGNLKRMDAVAAIKIQEFPIVEAVL